MASRIYSLTFILVSGLMGIALPPDLLLLTSQAQMTQDSKLSADQLIQLANQQLSQKQYREAIQSYKAALEIYQTANNLYGEGFSQLSLGYIYSNLGEYQKAIDAYLQSLAIFKQIDNRNGEGYSLLGLGNAYNGLGQYQPAIDYYQKSVVISKQIGDRTSEGKSFGSLGILYGRLGKYQQAIESSQQALEIFKQLGDRNSEKASLISLGFVYNSLGEHQKAIDYYQQALVIIKQIGDRFGEGDAFIGLGIAYISIGQYQQAIAAFQQSLEFSKQIRDRNNESTSLNGLGNAHNRLGQYQKAIDYYQQALVIFKQTSNLNGEGSTLGNLGTTFSSLGEYQKAIDYHQQSLAIFRQISDRLSEGKSLSNLGLTSNNIGQYQKAIDYYLQALALAKQSGDRSGEGTSLLGLGLTSNNLGQYQKAIDYYQQALAILKQIGDRNGEGKSLGGLGNGYYRIGKYQNAIDFYQQSLAISKQIGDLNGEGYSLIGLGLAYNNLGLYQNAIESYQQALVIAKQIGDRDGEGIILNNLGLSFYGLNFPDLAILSYKQSVNVRESIRKDIRGLSQEERKSYLGRVEFTYRILAGLLLNQGRVIEAIQVLDLLKVQELEDYLKNIKGNDRTAQGIRMLEPEKTISAQLSSISKDKIPELNRQLANQIQQLPKSELNKVPDYLKQIPQGTVLFYPLILSDRLELVLFSANAIPISRTVKISQEKLERLIADFRSGLLDAGSEDVKEPAQELYNLLIKPIETELTQAKAETILYAPDGRLRYIPLAALYDGKQWLIEKYRISNLIAYILSDFSPRSKSQPSILAGAFGGKVGERKFGQIALPATITEVQSIADSFKNSVTLTEESFSRQAIESKFKNHNILHLATHAEFNTGAPENSFIIFGNGDKIRLNEITNWQIPNLDLIVLSACQTGVGKLGDGVEILGFGYQVQKAGAKNAIASLWKVDDAGTQALMTAFYSALKKGDVTISEALHKAQISQIRSKTYGHPNYWSAFFAIGNGL
ncbi:MAG: tetratricopeptide repeat protein [Pseudanabaena sp.]